MCRFIDVGASIIIRCYCFKAADDGQGGYPGSGWKLIPSVSRALVMAVTLATMVWPGEALCSRAESPGRMFREDKKGLVESWLK